MEDITRAQVIANPDITINPRHRATARLEGTVQDLLANLPMRQAGQRLPSLDHRSQAMGNRMADTEHHRHTLHMEVEDTTLLRRQDSRLMVSHRVTRRADAMGPCNV